MNLKLDTKSFEQLHLSLVLALLVILAVAPLLYANPFVTPPKVIMSFHHLQSEDVTERRQGARDLWQAVGVFHHASEVRHYPGIVRKLVQMLEKETDRDVQISLLLTLAYLKDQRAKPILEKLARNAADRDV